MALEKKEMRTLLISVFFVFPISVLRGPFFQLTSDFIHSFSQSVSQSIAIQYILPTATSSTTGKKE
jgi:hypothetical protein